MGGVRLLWGNDRQGVRPIFRAKLLKTLLQMAAQTLWHSMRVTVFAQDEFARFLVHRVLKGLNVSANR